MAPFLWQTEMALLACSTRLRTTCRSLGAMCAFLSVSASLPTHRLPHGLEPEGREGATSSRRSLSDAVTFGLWPKQLGGVAWKPSTSLLIAK